MKFLLFILCISIQHDINIDTFYDTYLLKHVETVPVKLVMFPSASETRNMASSLKDAGIPQATGLDWI